MQIDQMFPHIAGYEKIKEEAGQIADLLQHPALYASRGAHRPRGWLFYGPPGMGKTRIVEDLASYLNYPIVKVGVSDSICRNITVDEDIVQGFAEAKRLGKAILFIDEMDKLAGYKKYEYEVPENLKRQNILIHELDQIKSFEGVAIIATANKTDYLADSVLRSGRFDRQVLFNLPNASDREKILRLFLKDARLGEGVNLQEVVAMTAGRSCAEIECIVNEALISATAKRRDEVVMSDFTLGYNRVIFKDIAKADTSTKEQAKMVAYHEAGHAYLSALLFPAQVRCASIIPQGRSDGSVGVNLDEHALHTLAPIENRVKIGLAGMLAVEVMVGSKTSGNTSDLEKCVDLIREACHDGFYGLQYTTVRVNNGYEGRFSERLNDQKGRFITKRLQKLARQTRKILRQGRKAIEALACALVEQKELSGAQIVEIVKNGK